jgi:hypothetical protein
MMKKIKELEYKIEVLEAFKEDTEKTLSTLKGQLKVEKIKMCKGVLKYIDEFRDSYVYECNICKNTRIFSLSPKNKKCKNNIN